MFSGGIEIEHWAKMDEKGYYISEYLVYFLLCEKYVWLTVITPIN